MDYSQLIQQIAERIGLEDFEPDENGLCKLVMEETEVSIQYFPECEVVLLFAPVSAVPADASADFYRSVCEANFLFVGTTGATLSIDPENSCLYLARYDYLAGLDDEAFYQHLMHFVTALQNIYTKMEAVLSGEADSIRDTPEPSDTQEEDDNDNEEAPNPLERFMLQV